MSQLEMDLENLFEESLLMPPRSREKYIGSVRKENPQLAKRLEELIRLYEGKQEGVAERALEQYRTTLSRQRELYRTGMMIGTFKIKRWIGSGGMGDVYEAEQEVSRRSVAVKVITDYQYPNATGEKVFEREVRALARLQHPGIATIFTSGKTEDGYLYLVMELVEGLPIDQFLLKNELVLLDRLNLFLQICDATAHAHQRGVLHCDLKPLNILVSTEGECGVPRTKVLDFGLARFLEEDSPLEEEWPYRSQICGTLPYMSPEHVSRHSGDVGVRSDVYSLGVILYEIVTGQLPYRIKSQDLLSAKRTICDAVPKRPRQVMAGVAPDLEAIILRSIEKSPSQRYSTSLSLAEDLRRFLKREPVLARKVNPMYRLFLLIRRNRLISLFLLTASAAIILGWFWHMERRYRETFQHAFKLGRILSAAKEHLEYWNEVEIFTSERARRKCLNNLTLVSSEMLRIQPGNDSIDRDGNLSLVSSLNRMGKIWAGFNLHGRNTQKAYAALRKSHEITSFLQSSEVWNDEVMRLRAQCAFLLGCLLQMDNRNNEAQEQFRLVHSIGVNLLGNQPRSNEQITTFERDVIGWRASARKIVSCSFDQFFPSQPEIESRAVLSDRSELLNLEDISIRMSCHEQDLFRDGSSMTSKTSIPVTLSGSLRWSFDPPIYGLYVFFGSMEPEIVLTMYLFGNDREIGSIELRAEDDFLRSSGIGFHSRVPVHEISFKASSDKSAELGSYVGIAVDEMPVAPPIFIQEYSRWVAPDFAISVPPE